MSCARQNIGPEAPVALDQRDAPVVVCSGETPVVFECEGEPLVGILHRAPQARRLGVLVVVGGPQYRVGSHRQFVLMARDFARAGYPVFRFDYRGMGDSGGAARSFERVGDDIRCAIDVFLRAADLDGVVLWGLCDAASACLMYCAGDPRVRGLILANPWVRTEAGEATSYIRHYYGRRLLQRSFWRKALKGELRVIDSMVDFTRKIARAAGRADAAAAAPQSFIERMRRGLHDFRGPALILISQNDLTAQEFLALCNANGAWRRLVRRDRVRMVDLERADHTFSSRDALDRASVRCLDWLNACCG